MSGAGANPKRANPAPRAEDNNGNLLTMIVGSNTTSFAWGFENRMSSATLPGSSGTVSFKYDPFGRRIYKSSSSGTSIYAYEGVDLIEETNSSGTSIARYVQGPHVDEPVAMLRSGATSYYQADGVGSITSLSSAAGSIANTYTYDSFGNLTASTGSLTNHFQYTARESDPETGLYYYRARYYDPITGKFLSEDLLGTKEEGPNLYIYTGNNPATNEDPLGRFTIDPSCKGRCHKFGGGGDQPQNLEQVIQQQTDLACSNLQGMVDAKWRSCVQQSCKKGKIKCKGADDKSCQDAGGYGGKKLLIFTGRTANLCPDNWSEPTPLEYVGAAVIHEWAHGCGYNTGPGVPYPDKPKRSR